LARTEAAAEYARILAAANRLLTESAFCRLSELRNTPFRSPSRGPRPVTDRQNVKKGIDRARENLPIAAAKVEK